MTRSALIDTTYATSAAAPASLPASLNVFKRLGRALVVRKQRRALLALDDRMLADVGLSQADAYREAHRPFLDMPANVRGTQSW